MNDDKRNFSREEDYRDFEQRDIQEGWPYADAPGAGARPVANGAYGEAGAADFDRERNEGYRISRAGRDGLQQNTADPVLPETDRRDIADALEASVHDILEELDGIDLAAVDVHVDKRVVTLRGAVDTAEERRRIERAVLATPGVANVRNYIRTRGVDTHIAPDAD